MNYNSLSDTEFMHYLDIYSDDPVVRRLINVLAKTRGALIDDLEHAGMDSQSWTFCDTWNKYSPGQYIEELRNDVRRAENELELAQEELQQAIDEREELKTRSIMKFVEEVQNEKRSNQAKVQEAMKQAETQKKENDRLREQIDMWGRLNHVKQGA
jgi:DNA repair exonuclease SbcCD ATPase subunit